MDIDEISVRCHRTCCAKIVRNVKTNLIREKEARQHCFAITRVSDRLKYLTGLSASTIQKLVNGTDVLPEGESETRERDIKMEEEDEQKIRPVIVALVTSKITPTLNIINDKLSQENDDWRWSRSSLRNALHRIGFHFNSKRKNYYDRLKEDDKNIVLRVKYLANYVNFINEDRPILFMGESWINKNCRPSNCRGTVETVEKVPPGKGARWTLIGAGGKDGWVPHSFRMWKGNVMSEDYHSEMNTSVFHDWIHNYFLPNVAPNSVLVIDRATYHLSITEDSFGAKAAWKKQELVDWIVSRHVKDDDGLLYTATRLLTLRKPMLWAICVDNKPKKKYQIHEWFKLWNTNHGTDIRVNILPIAHPQLNPIELVWSWIKRHVASNNHDFSMVTIARLTKEKVAAINAEWWQKACDKSHNFALQCILGDDMALAEAEEEPEGAEMAENEENSDVENDD